MKDWFHFCHADFVKLERIKSAALYSLRHSQWNQTSGKEEALCAFFYAAPKRLHLQWVTTKSVAAHNTTPRLRGQPCYQPELLMSILILSAVIFRSREHLTGWFCIWLFNLIKSLLSYAAHIETGKMTQTIQNEPHFLCQVCQHIFFHLSKSKWDLD